MSMSCNFHLDHEMRVMVHNYNGDPTLTGACVDISGEGCEHISIHGPFDQLEALGRDIINGVAALRAAGPLPDPDDDDDEDDPDGTQPEPEAVALLPETALVDAKGK